jgi:hypothetical protein
VERLTAASDFELARVHRSYDEVIERHGPADVDKPGAVVDWLREDFMRNEMEEIYLVRSPFWNMQPTGVLYASLYTPQGRCFVNFLAAPDPNSFESDAKLLWATLRRTVESMLLRHSLPAGLRWTAGPWAWVRVLFAGCRFTGRCVYVFAEDACEGTEDAYRSWLVNQLAAGPLGKFDLPDEESTGTLRALPAPASRRAREELVECFYLTHWFWSFSYRGQTAAEMLERTAECRRALAAALRTP